MIIGTSKTQPLYVKKIYLDETTDRYICDTCKYYSDTCICSLDFEDHLHFETCGSHSDFHMEQVYEDDLQAVYNMWAGRV